MEEFYYTLDEYFEIIRALGGKTNVKPHKKPTPTQSWKWKGFKPIKKRLKLHRLKEQNNTCCYCQRNIKGEFKLILDVEHVLPKSVFNHCIFDLPNLAVSCRRCNWNVKGKNTDFFDQGILNIPKMHKSDLFKQEHYIFAHPNLVDRFKHLSIKSEQDGPRAILYYRIYSKLGRQTYNYFRLHEFEINSLDKAQGVLNSDYGGFYDKIQQLEHDIYNDS